MKRIIYMQANGMMAIIVPAPKWEGTLKALAEKTIPAGISYEIIDTCDIPKDRTFRNAWEKNNKAVKVNMDKARNIHMGHIRWARDKKFLELDIEQLKGNDVAAQKQALRDILNIPPVEVR